MTDADLKSRAAALDADGVAAWAEAAPAREIISREHAKAHGLKRYFTGEPCPNGHVCDRLVNEYRCVDCINARRREYRAKKTPAYLQLKERSAHKLKEMRRAKRAERGAAPPLVPWKERNPDYQKLYYRNVRKLKRPSEGRVAYLNEWRKKTQEARTVQNREWRRANPDKMRAHNAARRGRLRDAEGRFTSQDAAEIRARQRDRCAYCRTKLNGGGHLDHIVAISKGGTNWPNNLQWLCAPCNSSKSARDPIDFAQSRGLLL